MAISHTQQGSATIVRLGGSLDAAIAPAVREELKTLIDAGRHRLVVDLSDVQFVDSSGLSILVTTLKAARNKDGDLVLCCLSPPVRSIVELTRLHRILTICDDAAEAVKKLG